MQYLVSRLHACMRLSYILFAPLYYFHCGLCLTLCDMWALTMRRSFHTPKVSGIGYLKGEGLPNTRSRLLAHSVSIIDTWLSVQKTARLSVEPFDEYFSWQRGHLTRRCEATCGPYGRCARVPVCVKGKLKVLDHVKVHVTTCVWEIWL